MKLQDYITNHGMTDAEFATRIGSSQPHVNRIRRGIIAPSMKIAMRIKEATKGQVTPNDLANHCVPELKD